MTRGTKVALTELRVRVRNASQRPRSFTFLRVLMMALMWPMRRVPKSRGYPPIALMGGVFEATGFNSYGIPIATEDPYAIEIHQSTSASSGIADVTKCRGLLLFIHYADSSHVVDSTPNNRAR